MFDDKPNNPNPMVPNNLPTAPQKMSREPEDILDTIDEAPDNVATPAKPGVMPSPTSVPPSMPSPEKTTSREPFTTHYKKFIVIVLGVLVLAGVAYGGWYGYGMFLKSSNNQTAEPSINNQPVVDDGPSQEAVNQALGIPPTDDTGVAAEPKPIDSDSDGLDDEEEKLYGTDPNRVDTDLDGLTDRDEVKVFKTDPNNPDSDGDTFLDGNEVRAGYDPKGDGKLLEINN